MRPLLPRLLAGNAAAGPLAYVPNTVTATVAVGKQPWSMALTPGGSKLYVANGRSDSVSVIDTGRFAKRGVSIQ